jgi:outer membrane lipoprotein-sorting protein
VPESGERQKNRGKVLSIAGDVAPVIALVAVAFVITAALASGPAVRAAQGPRSVEDVLKQLDREAREFQSLTADVERTKVTVVVNDHSTESGKMAIRRDNKMRIDLTSPDPRTILRDGDHLYVFNPKANRVEEYDLSKHRALVDQFLLLGFGTSGQSLTASYSIMLQGEEMLGNQKVVRLELIPKSQDVRNEISKIALWMDEATWLPAQQQFFETGSGDYFIIHYTNVDRNSHLADSRFKPHWPNGVTRVKPQG